MLGLQHLELVMDPFSLLISDILWLESQKIPVGYIIAIYSVKNCLDIQLN
jgi:hypothetical protein